jgi:hypothetical protein
LWAINKLFDNPLVILVAAIIKILREEDWQDWKTIRLEAVRLHPAAFGGAYEDVCLNSSFSRNSSPKA